MADTLVEIKTLMVADDCIPQRIAPTGVRYSAEHVEQTAMFVVVPEVLKDGKWEKDMRRGIPNSLLGKFTSRNRVHDAVYKELREAWRISDEKKVQNDRRKPRQTESVGSVESAPSTSG